MAETQTIESWDEQGNLVKPVPQSAPQAWDEQGNPVEPAAGQRQLPSGIDRDKATYSLVASHMLSLPPSVVYQNHDFIKDEISKRSGGVPSDTPSIADDIKEGLQSSIFGLAYRDKMPDSLRNPSAFDQFVGGLSEMAADLPFYLFGGMAGATAGSAIPGVGTAAGAAMGAFAVPAAMRESLTLAIQKGEIKDFGDLMERTLETTYAGAKGMLLGRFTGLAGAATVPLGRALGPAANFVEPALKAAQQAATLTVLSDAMEGRIPTASDFGRNAAVIGALALVTHGVSKAIPDGKQALLDVYAKDGTTPQQSEVKLQAQPPVQHGQAEGLQPAIKLADGQHITGEGETHSDLAERALGERPVSMDELEGEDSLLQPGEPRTLADKVLANSEVHEQSVIDRANEIQEASASLGAPSDIVPLRNQKSGRGFDVGGKYLNRSQAKMWVKDNEPEVYDMWTQVTGDEKAEMHSEDYQEARKRVADRNVVEGEPQLSSATAEIQGMLARNRAELNEVKANPSAKAYGKSVIRTLFVGTRNTVRAGAEQVAGKVAKLLPDHVDQEAMSFMRDYRDDPNALRQDIEEIRQGDNERLKQAIPSMERALAPTPAMLEADAMLTDYFKQANDLRRTFVGATSTIDPERYSPRNFMLTDEENAAEDQERGMGRAAKFTKRSPHDIRREHLRLLDPLKSGGVEARTFNAVDELKVYGDRLATSVATSVFQMELKNTELGKYGARVVTDPESGEKVMRYPSSWVELPGTHRSIVIKGEDGETHVIQQAMHVPKNIADAMRPVLEGDVISSAPGAVVAKTIQGFIKSMEVGLVPFHMRAMGISFMNNARLDAFWKATTLDNEAPEFEAMERTGALYGLETTKTGTPYEAYLGLKESSLDTRSSLLQVARKGYEPIDRIFKGMTKATFEVAQRKFKVIDFGTRKAAWEANHSDATDVEHGKAMRSIANEINAVYGGLNWEVMGVSANWQAVARMFLLAPDWTFSNIANLKYAGEGGPGGNAARLFWLKSFTTGYALSQGMSLMLTGQQSKHWNEVYLGNDDKGKEMYANLFNVGAPKDLVTLVTRTQKDGFPTGLLEYGSYKLGPLAGTGIGLLRNRDYQGKPIFAAKDDALDKTIKGTEYAAKQLTPAPFTLKDMTDRIMNPDEDFTYKDFLAATVGATVIHEGAKPGKSNRKGFHLAGAKR